MMPAHKALLAINMMGSLSTVFASHAGEGRLSDGGEA